MTTAPRQDNRRVRVLHVIDSLNLGGAQTALLTMCRALPHDRFDVRVAALHGPGVFTQAFQRIGIEPHFLANHKHDPRIPLALRSLLKAWPPDICHAHLVPSCFLCEMLRRPLGIRRLVSHLHTPYRKNLRDRYQNFLERMLYKRCDLLLGCSDDVVRSIPRQTPKRTLYNAIDTERFQPFPEESRAAIRRELGYAPEDIVIGMTGRMIATKGHELVCRAVASLRSECPRARLLFVGSGPHDAPLRTRVRELHLEDYVAFAGYREDIERCLAAMDIYAMATSVEGFGLSLVEAMSSGLACVVSEYPAVGEIVADNKNVLLFPCNDTQRLTAAIRTLVNDPALRHRLGVAARAHICRAFSLERLGECLVEIYNAVIS
ncbi:MAG TPA: glycosyltransferase [Candidatus Hydrogenedentes bacterium]|nr:glycosyltransferase [Candidatus Hydrogenedentota bacterium]HOS02293.1 glycosyltransferase [Candidatus Hydrogenedentota bacterium]